MITVIEQLNSLLKADTEENGFEKAASFLAQRQNELHAAPNEDFALIIFDGEHMHRKFPIQTETDISLSKQILDKISGRLPDEVEKTARYFIDQAARERLAEPAYEERPASMATNFIYAGHIDNRRWHDKLAMVRPEGDVVIAGFRIENRSHVRQLEAALSGQALGLNAMEEAQAGVALVKRADALGVPLEKDAVKRYGRTSIPARFSDQVAYRKELSPAVFHEYYDDLMKEASVADCPEKLLDVARCVEHLDIYSGFSPIDGATRTFSKLGFETPGPVDVVFPEDEPEPEAQDLAQVAEFFGEEFADAFMADPEAAMATLSPSERYAVMRLLNEDEA